jgi:hypothetical protein
MPSPVLIIRNSGPAWLGDGLPGLERADRTGLHVPPPWRADLGLLPRLVGFAAGDAQPQPVGDHGDIFHLESHQLRAAQRAGEA